MAGDLDETGSEASVSAHVARLDRGQSFYRHKLATRLWHWTNALSVFVMLMSGLMIFNAHPRLYRGRFGANPDHPWLEVMPGHIRIGPVTLPGLGIFGVEANGRGYAVNPLFTIPSHYDLSGSREWHFAFAWLLVVPGILYLAWTLIGRHKRDLAPTRDELRPSHILHDIGQHARLRFPTGEAARRYNILQKLAYVSVIFVLLPGVIMTGMTMSPGLDAAWPWMLDLFGGRQSARSIHFLLRNGAGRLHRRAPANGRAGGSGERDPVDDHRLVSPAPIRCDRPWRRLRNDDRAPAAARSIVGAGGLMVAGCDQIAASPNVRKILQLGEKATYSCAAASHRSGTALAPEFSLAQMSPVFRINGSSMPNTADYARSCRKRLRGLAAGGRWAGRASAAAFAGSDQADATSHADHPPRLRRGLERDRPMDGDAAETAAPAGGVCDHRRAMSCFIAPTCRRQALL